MTVPACPGKVHRAVSAGHYSTLTNNQFHRLDLASAPNNEICPRADERQTLSEGFRLEFGYIIVQYVELILLLAEPS
jgi:hypothetical protein